MASGLARRLLQAATAAIAALAIGQSAADIQIHLKSGEVVSVPVKAEDVVRIELAAPPTRQPGAVSSDKRMEPQLPPAPTPVKKRAEATPPPGPRVHRIGPGQPYEKPSEIAKAVRDGDTVEILPGTYLNDSVVWSRSNLTIRGVGGRPHFTFDDTGKIKNGKGIWVITGENVVVENIEFSGAKVRDRNGAGIRVEGNNLTVRNCHFHHNQVGLMTGRLAGDITIENSEFGYQQREGQFTHAVYVGDVNRFLFRGNYVHNTAGGHHVKSRAKVSEILYNRLTDEKDGTASYLIDLSQCGRARVIGNLLHKGRGAENATGIAYGAEGCGDREKDLAVVNNTYVNHYANGGPFVRNWSLTPVLVANNLLVSPGSVASGQADEKGNLVTRAPGFQDAATFDYRLGPRSPAIDAAVPVAVGGSPVVPESEYVHPRDTQRREAQGTLDVGAYEYRG
jgi:hypothetical protein